MAARSEMGGTAGSGVEKIPVPGLSVTPAATRTDFSTAAAILDEAAAWVTAQGLRSWQPGAFGTPGTSERGALLAAFRSGDLYLARDHVQPVATVSLLWEDRVYWPDARADGAYVHRLAVLRSAAGRGIGRAVLSWAEEAAGARGRTHLRLDCVADDALLRAYYERAGFRHRGDLTVRGVDMSLYEKPISRASGRLPQGTSR